jgi:hypothetical protein
LNGLHETITFTVDALFGADVVLAALLDIILAIFVVVPEDVSVPVGTAAVCGGGTLANDDIGAHVVMCRPLIMVLRPSGPSIWAGPR